MESHGGRLIEARQLFPDAPSPFLDLSTGISPFPYPLPPLPPELWTRLPEPEQEQALRRVAAERFGAPDPGRVAIAPGSQMLISLLPRLLGCGAAVILSPTYGGHERAWAGAGIPVSRVGTVAALSAAAASGTALVLCNPNNPDGRRLEPDAIAALARRSASAGGWLLVDEAFADLEPAHVPAAALLPSAPRLVVLRSFGKSYGLAGVRLGFLLADPVVAASAASAMGPWPVGGAALRIGTLALSDTGWLRTSTALAATAAARLDRVLRAGGFEVEGGTVLFRLARRPDAALAWRRLARAGILTRRFESMPDRLRFGLPGDETAWRRLEQAFAG